MSWLRPPSPYIKVPDAHGTLRTHSSMLPVTSNWIPTLQNIGIPQNPDPAGGQSWGAYIATSAINSANWTRSHSRAAYIDPLPPRDNLQILAKATVTKILFDDNLTATGVQFASTKGGPVTTISVKKEVLLAAGSIGSPNILMQSGVGPKDVLTAAGVDVKLDLPGVGNHLQDHIVSSVTLPMRIYSPFISEYHCHLQDHCTNYGYTVGQWCC